MRGRLINSAKQRGESAQQRVGRTEAHGVHNHDR